MRAVGACLSYPIVEQERESREPLLHSFLLSLGIPAHVANPQQQQSSSSSSGLAQKARLVSRSDVIELRPSPSDSKRRVEKERRERSKKQRVDKEEDELPVKPPGGGRHEVRLHGQFSANDIDDIPLQKIVLCRLRSCFDPTAIDEQVQDHELIEMIFNYWSEFPGFAYSL